MNIHHLNCGSICPACQRLMQGRGGWFDAAKMCCHCLLIEDEQGLVLVDTGFGTLDIEQPKRLGGGFLATMRPKLLLAETALYQVKALGYDPADVRHIVPTHLDLDHAGGLPDFPAATVHVLQAEHDAALHPTTIPEKGRYRQHQFAHGPKWQTYQPSSQTWFGFEGVQQVKGLSGEVLIVPLLGHTKGHSGIAIKQGSKWLLHVGDLYFDRRSLTADAPMMMRVSERLMAHDNRQRLANVGRVAALLNEHANEVEVFCAHDPLELAQMQQ
jgi:glyoxylase-like metal-dependent hydrolase (beta-lactamase superfamily II)